MTAVLEFKHICGDKENSRVFDVIAHMVIIQTVISNRRLFLYNIARAEIRWLPM